MSRILVVEDSVEILESLRNHLEMDGHDVVVATRGAQCMALLASHHPELVILDVELPDRDGFTVLQEMRARGNGSPVLMLTARALEDDRLTGFRLGADDYVTKPFSIMELLARVSAILRRGGVVPTAAPPSRGPAPLTDDELRQRFGLTPRQIEVARLMSEGFSNGEIAGRLAMSYYTARNHTEQIFARMGVSGRAAVGAILYGKG